MCPVLLAIPFLRSAAVSPPAFGHGFASSLPSERHASAGEARSRGRAVLRAGQATPPASAPQAPAPLGLRDMLPPFRVLGAMQDRAALPAPVLSMQGSSCLDKIGRAHV